MKFNKIYFLIIFSSFIFSCNQKTNLKNISNEKINYENKTVTSEITSQYEIKYCLDTLGREYPELYTIDYYNIIHSGNILISDFDLNDIVSVPKNRTV